ncbi:MAG TPA: AAA family ATPase [Anaerolineales bacterium]|nr:AAA family ATPase [Anaerolineales bacterium]
MATRKKHAAPPHPAAAPELPADALHRPCDPDLLGFETTDELPDLEDVIGQPRAIRALQLGSEVSGPGYNVFVLGFPGSGRTTLSREYLERKAAREAIPDDWCYVNNFEDPSRPRALRLPPGTGAGFRKALGELIRRCENDLPRIFEGEEYVRERERLVNDLKKVQESEFSRLQQHVGRFNFMIVRTSSGFVLTPAVEGKPLTPEEMQALSEEQRAKLVELESRLGEEVEKTLLHLGEMEKEALEKLRQLVSRTLLFHLGPLIEALKAGYAKLPAVVAHLEAVQNDIIANTTQFQPSSPAAEGGQRPTPAERQPWGKRYAVNLVVDNSNLKGAPVVAENYPSYPNLLGRIEHEVIQGASFTDFTMIQPGALHRANGGYLVLPARDLLINPYAWEGLKRVLRDQEIRIIEMANQLGLVSTATLEPEPIPVQVKVVLVGTPMLYYLLRAHDEDFTKLFKVRAEFATLMDRTPENEREYGLFVKSVVMENHLPPFDKTAVAKIVEYSSRLADDQGKLSTRFGKIADLIREAAYWASKKRRKRITAAAVQQAIDESIYRSNLVEERMQEVLEQGTITIAVKGRQIGQINALSVYMLGDYEFGRPTRVTAIAYPGKAGVMDVERQTKLGGSLHTKGVLILTAYLNARYGQDLPLSLTASLTFEQSYEEVQGDSASAAELLALLSFLARVPLRQDRAITGSLNQLGQVQAIGGVNEKIEGFFAVCKRRGLTGEQGVIIPATNRRHLMLSAEVVKAVAAGKFHIWTIQRLDEAIPLLTDRSAGERRPDGDYPKGSFNAAVAQTLSDYNKAVQAANKGLARPGEANGKENANQAKIDENKSGEE